MPFLKKILTFKAKKWHFWRTFLEPLGIFTNLQWNFLKLLHPSTPWNELAAPRTLKIIENGPWVKKSGHPWDRAYQTSKYTVFGHLDFYALLNNVSLVRWDFLKRYWEIDTNIDRYLSHWCQSGFCSCLSARYSFFAIAFLSQWGFSK